MPPKKYPPFYEKAIPAALVVIGLLVISLLVVIMVVIAGR